MKEKNRMKIAAGLRERMLLIALLGAFIPMAVFSVIIVFFTSGTIVGSVSDKNEKLIKAINRMVDMELSSEVGHTKHVKDSIENNTRKGYEVSLEVFQGYMDNCMIKLIEVADMRGYIKYVYPEDEGSIGTDISNTRRFKEIMAGKNEYWEETYLSEHLGIPMTNYSIALKGGMITAHLQLDAISGLSEYIENKKGSFIAVTDNNGIFIAHTDGQKVLRSEPDNYFFTIKDRLKDGKYSGIFKVGGKRFICNAAMIKTTGWLLQIWQDEDELLAGTYILRYFLLTVILITAAVLYFFISKIASVVKESFGEIIKQAGEVAAGNYTARLKPAQFKDFEPIVERFNAMVEEIMLNEKEIRKTLAELKRSNEDLEQYANATSHDLKEPMRTIAAHSDLLERKYSAILDDEGKEILRILKTNSTRMITYLKNILDYSRAGRFDEGVKTVNTSDVVKDEAKTTFKDRKFKLETGELPCIKGDSVWVRRIFRNLIDNAIKFNRSENPVVTVFSRKVDNFYEFTVADNGLGIDPEYQQKIFEPFSMLHPRNDFEGTGLGLALCKKVVERHGGKIWIESNGEQSGGTAVKFTLPSCVMDSLLPGS